MPGKEREVEFPTPALRAALTADELALIEGLDSPERIQAWLAEQVQYNFEPDGETAMGPIQVLRTGRAHCFEGAIFAGALFWYHGLPPQLVLLEAPQDFDHNLIVYTRGGKVGSVSQSRHAELRGKPAVYGSLRDLVMAYYPDYYSDWTHNPQDLTLRGFSEPIDLRQYGSAWVTNPEIWDIYHSYAERARLEKLFPSGEGDRYYSYPKEHLRE